MFCVVCCRSSERGSFFVSARFFINFTPLLFVVVYSGHNMIIFLWPTFNLFAHVSATCNGSVREIGREGERERECGFLLPQYRHLSAHAFIFVRKIANQLRSFCPAFPSGCLSLSLLSFSFRCVRHFRFPHYTNGRSFIFNNMRYYSRAPFVCAAHVWDWDCVRRGVHINIL